MTNEGSGADEAAFANGCADDGGVGAEEAVAADFDTAGKADADGEAAVVSDDVVVGEADGADEARAKIAELRAISHQAIPPLCRISTTANQP